MKAYSKDLRVRVIDAVDRGLPRAEVTEHFQVSLRVLSAVEGSNGGSIGGGSSATSPPHRARAGRPA